MKTEFYGHLAGLDGLRLPLQVLHSEQGFYLGTSVDGGPYSRESEEYWTTFELSKHALDHQEFTQRDES